MAPGLRRWLLAVTLGCAAIAVAHLPPPIREPRNSNARMPPDRSWEERVKAALSRNERQLRQNRRTAALREAARARRPAWQGLQVELRGTFLPGVARQIRATVDSMWTDAVPGTPRVRTLFVIDGTSGGPSYLMPPPNTDGQTCVLFGSVDEGRGELAFRLGWIDALLAPCVYYATFGIPGPAIQGWLERRFFDIAGSADWRVPDTAATTFPRSVPLTDRILVRMLYYTIVQDDAESSACAKGRLERCAAGVLQRVTRNRATGLSGIYQVGFSNGYLSALARQMGTERFQRFWSSTLPVDEAFAAAFDVGLGSWTAERQRQHLPVVPTDTKPGAVLVLLGVLTMLAATAAAAVVAERRRVA